MVEAPQTEEGWYVLHDFRTVDWDAWRDAPERDREAAVEEGEAFLRRRERLARSEDGDSAVFSVVGHEADLLFLHFRPTLDAVERVQRDFEGTAFAAFTERAYSYVSVTEVSGYVSDDYFADPESVDEGLRRYIEGKLRPSIPEDTYVSFYPMRKRRRPEQNWYALPAEERADLMADHGDVGREFAGRIEQVISSSVGLDDWEWGVTLFGDDPADIKDIVYEMRFDEASSTYGDFGRFLVGRRFPPADLRAFLDGETVPAPEGEEGREGAPADHPADDRGGHHGHHGHRQDHAGGEAGTSRAGAETGGHHGGSDDSRGDSAGGDGAADVREELADLDVYAGQPHGEDVYALVLYSEADPDELQEAVAGLRGNFEHYDTHVKTAVYGARDADRRAVVSIWDTQSAADTAAGFLADLPGVVGRANDVQDGWGTMGMFYTVEPEHREDFTAKFEQVTAVLDDADGHVETHLMVNREDENDMFVASEWESRADAMSFFRSDAFRETVDWGRDVLADRPRHVFLA